MLNDLKKKLLKFKHLNIIIDIYNHLRHPLQQSQIWKDYFKTKSEAKFIRKNTWNKKNKTAIIAANNGSIYQIKVESLLATGLRMHDWNIVALTSRKYPWAKRYFKLFGVNQFYYWEDVNLEDVQNNEIEAALKNFINQEYSFPLIKKWQYKNIKIGPQVLSSVSRLIHQGFMDFNSPGVKNKINASLKTAMSYVDKADNLLSKINPDLLYINEANYNIAGQLVDVAIKKNINVIQVTQPAQDDGLMLKRLNNKSRGIHPSSLSNHSLDKALSMPWTEKEEQELEQLLLSRYDNACFLQARNQPNTKLLTKTTIQSTLNLDPNKKTAVVFSHILWDANLFYGEDLFKDYGDWFIQTIKAACENPEINWIIKLHPANVWKRNREKLTGEFSEVTLIKKHIGELPNHVKLLYPNTEISTYSLFSFIDYGITVRGTIGIELPCFGVTTFTAGTGRYSNMGFTEDSNSKEEYLEKLKNIQTYPSMSDEKKLLAKKHAYYLLKLRPWPIKSFITKFNYRKTGTHPLDQNLSLTVRSIDDIIAKQDLIKWSNWASQTEVDYLEQ